MPLRIVCSGFLLRYPLGGFGFHHLQYLLGFMRLGHHVTYFEDFGWPGSCYDPDADDMTSDPSIGLAYLRRLFADHGIRDWCYLAEDGMAHWMSREALVGALRDCDLYISLSNINWIDELMLCRRRVMIDTDPVFTQIDGHGYQRFDNFHARFTYGANVHKPTSSMPTAGLSWLPTRQPIVLDLWKPDIGDAAAPVTTIMNWSAYGAHESDGVSYCQKDVTFEPMLNLPRQSATRMQLALAATDDVRDRITALGCWEMINARTTTRTPAAYQQLIRDSKAEFSTAKHGYVVTRCGWFSDRSAAFLASGRPVVVQDTGFSDFLPCGRGLLAFSNAFDAAEQLRRLDDDYPAHCRAARSIAEEFFDSDVVLHDLLGKSL